MILVNFINGQPDKPSNLQIIQTWWQNMNGKIPKIAKIESSTILPIYQKSTTIVSLNSPVTNVSINGNNITWNIGTTQTAIVTSIVLDANGNNLKFSVASNPSIDWEFQY